MPLWFTLREQVEEYKTILIGTVEYLSWQCLRVTCGAVIDCGVDAMAGLAFPVNLRKRPGRGRGEAGKKEGHCALDVEMIPGSLPLKILIPLMALVRPPFTLKFLICSAELYLSCLEAAKRVLKRFEAHWGKRVVPTPAPA